MIITAMTIMELSIAVVSIIGACGGCLHGSKCTSCKVGCNGCELTRRVPSNDPDVASSTSLQEPPSTDEDYTPQAPSRDIR